MSHLVIIRGGNYSETELAEGEARAEIEWSPAHDMSEDDEVALFRKQLRRYKKAVAMDSGGD